MFQNNEENDIEIDYIKSLFAIFEKNEDITLKILNSYKYGIITYINQEEQTKDDDDKGMNYSENKYYMYLFYGINFCHIINEIINENIITFSFIPKELKRWENKIKENNIEILKKIMDFLNHQLDEKTLNDNFYLLK